MNPFTFRTTPLTFSTHINSRLAIYQSLTRTDTLTGNICQHELHGQSSQIRRDESGVAQVPERGWQQRESTCWQTKSDAASMMHSRSLSTSQPPILPPSSFNPELLRTRFSSPFEKYSPDVSSPQTPSNRPFCLYSFHLGCIQGLRRDLFVGPAMSRSRTTPLLLQQFTNLSSKLRQRGWRFALYILVHGKDRIWHGVTVPMVCEGQTLEFISMRTAHGVWAYDCQCQR